MEADDGEIIVEMLDASQISENELDQFEVTEPLEVVGVLPPSPIKKVHSESEEVQIQKFVSGEMEFPDCYRNLRDDEDSDEDVYYEEEDVKPYATMCPVDYSKASTSAGEPMDVQCPQTDGKKGSFRKKSTLSPALLGLMGEANLSFARGNAAIAEKICMEIIRQNPLAPEPFMTLAQIYEFSDADKFFNFMTIAAHLDPSNKDQWIRIAEMQIQRKNYKQARIFYSKAIRYIPKDYDLRLRKGKLLEQMNEKLLAMTTYLKMIPVISIDHGEFCLATAKNVARYFHNAKKMNYALKAMKDAYVIAAPHFSCEDINLYLELLLINKDYSNVLLVMSAQYNMEVEIEMNGDQMIVVFCLLPDNLLAELRAKVCVSLIHLKAFHLLEYLIRNILEFIPVSEVELYIDLAEALMSEEKFAETIQLLNPIIDNHYDTPPLVWLRYAESQRSLGNVEVAIQCYYSVLEKAPFCYDAKFTLSALLKQQGRHREAIKALEQDMEGDTINPRMLYERCLMLKTIEEIDQYIDVGYLLLARSSIKLRNREELLAASGSFFSSGVKTIVQGRLHLEDPADQQTLELARQKENTDLTIEEEFELFKDLLKLTFDLKMYPIMQKICYAVSTAKRFALKQKDIEKYIILASYYNDDSLVSFYYFRDLLTRNVHNQSMWNFMGVLIQKGESLNYHRFLRRFFSRNPSMMYLKIYLGNYHLYCSSFKYALSIYLPIYKEIQDPLVCLLIAIAFGQLSLQKKVLKKTSSVAQALAFAKRYSDLRMSSSTEQEIFYNIGRIYHQAGIMYLALSYYEKALVAGDEEVRNDIEVLGLSQEIAFNIHLIYRANGNIEMARKYLYKYIVV